MILVSFFFNGNCCKVERRVNCISMAVQEVYPQSTEDGIVVDGVSSVAKVENRQTASTSVTEDDKRPSFSEQKNSQTVPTYGTEDDRRPSISDQKNGQNISTTGTEDHKKLSDSEYEIDRAFSTSCDGLESNRASEICRVCQCDEPDRRGDAALVFLGISPPVDFDLLATRGNGFCGEDTVISTETIARSMMCEKEHGFIKFVSPDGEVFTCNENEDLEAGTCHYQDALITLGCSCKNDLSLAHYACALRWFISHGSLVCEICGSAATNIRDTDVQKVMASLKDCESLRERTAAGELASAEVQMNSGIDPDAVAAIRRQRLTEISLWFNPQNHFASMSQRATDQVSMAPPEDVSPSENRTTKWAVEGTGILIATGLLTLTLAWLIAPHVGKRIAKSGLHILLGGLCALAVVVVLRFIVLPRIKYGPARYWAILFVFWFLVFAVWASRARTLHNT